MQKTFLFVLIVILAITQTQIIPIIQPVKLVQTIKKLDNLIIATQNAQVYYGNIQINIQNGDNQKSEFYSTLIPYEKGCSFSKCFYGWVNNYTITGEPTLTGYGNKQLNFQPVFEFRTNSEEDFVIIRHPKLQEQWVQTIQILCQKINPQITQNSNIKSKQLQKTFENLKFQSIKTSQITANMIASPQFSPATSNLFQKPQTQAVLPKYTFENYIDPLSRTINIGDKIARLSEPILLQDLKAPTSLLTETVILNSQNLVKNRNITYNLKLASDLGTNVKGQESPDLNGFVSLNFNLIQRTKVSVNNVQTAKKLLSDVSSRIVYNYKSINQKRANLGDIFYPESKIIIDNGPQQEDAEILVFMDQKFSGINVAEKISGDTFEVSNNLQTVDSRNTNNQANRRMLQLIQNHTIYNYKKTLFSQTILGKSFKAQAEVKCYILVYPSDHQIQCIGTINYELFGKTKSVTIFNYKKSISFAWSWSKQFKGDWSFSVYVPLPPPVSFMGINFTFKISYLIDVKINALTSGLNPYNIKVSALATTQVNTDASAALRIIAIQGGVFIKGTLVKVGTDPTFNLSYNFVLKQVKVLAQWYFWVYAFQYNWGFFYRTWKLFKGWSSRKIIKQWTINGLYGKWAIVNRSWIINL